MHALPDPHIHRKPRPLTSNPATNPKKEINIQVLVNLAALPVLSQQTTEDAHPPEPLHLGGHTGLGGTLPLTGTGVTAETLGGVHLARAGAGRGVGWLDDAKLLVRSCEVYGMCELRGVAWDACLCGFAMVAA
jgi:hypothetical protein